MADLFCFAQTPINERTITPANAIITIQIIYSLSYSSSSIYFISITNVKLLYGLCAVIFTTSG